MLRVPGSALDSSPQNGPTIDQDFLEKISKDLVSRIVRERASAINELYELLEDGCKRIQYKQATWSPVASALLKAVSLENEVSGDHSSKRIQIMLRLFKKIAPFKFDVEEVIELISELCQTNIGLDILSCFGSLYVHGQMKKSKNTVSSIKIIVEIACECYKTSKTNFEFLELSKAIFSASTLIASLCDEHLSLTLFNSILTVIEFTNPNDGKENNVTHLLLSSLHQIMPIIKGRQSLIYYRIQNSSFLNGSNLYALHVSLIYDVIRIWIYLINPPSHFKSILDHALIQRLKIIDENPIDVASNSIIKFLVDHLSKLDVTNKSTLDRRVILLLTSSLKNQSFELVSFIDCITNMTISQQSWVLTAFANLKDDRLVQFALSSITRPRLAKFSQFYLYKCTPSGIFKSLLSLVDCKCSFKLILDQFRINFSNCLWSLNSALAYDKCLSNLSQLFTSENEAKTVIKFLLENMPAIIEFLRIPIINAETHPSILQSSHKFVQDSQLFISKNDPSIVDSAISFTVGFKTFKKNETKESIFNFLLDVPYERELASKLDLIISKYSPKINLCEYIWTNLKSINTSTSHFEIFEIGRIMSAILSELSLCDSNNSDSQVDQLLLQIEPIFDKVKTVKQGFSLLIDIFDHYASMEDSHFLESILKDCCDFVLLKLTSNNEDHQFKINILSFIVKHHSYIDLELLLNFFESIKPQALLFQSIHTCFMDSRATKTLALISEIPGHPSNRLIIDFVRFISMFSIELIRKSDPFELYRCFIAKTKSFSNSPDSDTIMRLALPNLIEVTSNPFDLNMKIADCLRDVLVTHPSELDLLDSLRLYLGTSSLIISYSLLDSLRVPQIILTYLCPNYVRFEMFVFWQIYQQQTTLDDLLADVELLQCGFASIIARISLLNHVSKQYITNMKATLAHNFVTLSSTLVFRSCAFALLIHGKETPLNFLFASIFSLLEISCPITENFETETGIMNAILAELLDIIREEPILKPFLSCICDSNPSFLNLDGPISKVLKNMLKDGPSEYTSNQNHGTYHNTSDLQTFMIESLEIHLFSTATFNAPISQIRHLFWIANFRSDKRNQDQKFPYLKFDRQILPTLSIAEKKALNTVEGRSRIVWKAYYSLNEALFPSKMLSVVLTDDSLVEFIGWRVIAEALLTSNDFLSRCVDKSDIKWSWHHLARALRYCVGKNFSASVNAEIFRSIWVDEITIKNMDDYPDHTGPHDSSTKVKEFPTEALYLLELSGLNDTKLYRHVYSNLNMSQYVKHIDSLSQTLPMFYSRGALEELSSASMMALQQWDMESFTDHVDVKELEVFTLIRNAYHSKDCNSLDKLNPGTIITKIAKESAIFIIKDGLNLKDLESNCIKMYIDEKNYKQASPLLWAHALESTSRWHQKSSQLDLLSKLAKADFFVHTGNSHMAQAVLNSAVKCVLKNTTEVSTLLSNRIFIGSAKLHWEGRTLPLNRIRIELINRIHLPHANSTWRENLNTQYRKSNTSDPESSNTAYFAARFFDDQYRELQETETSQLDMFHEELILYGKTAAINYATALHFGDRHDLCVFRLISIGLSLMSIDMEAASEVIAGTGIPTRKLLPLVFQLAARLGIESTSKSSNYECLLSRTLLEILLDHPHHVLYQLLSLANPANHNCTKSKMAPTKTSKRRIVDINGTVQDMDQDSEDEKKSKIRSNLALKIINTAKSICSSERLSMIVNSQLLCKAYTRAALHPVPLDASTTDSHPFPSDWLLGTICNLPVPVITLDIPVDHTLKYDNLPTIQRFLHESYRVIGGINMPKIVECLASDGRIFRQLIKGQDDLRQDAVMQQVFKLVNQIILDQDTFSGYITAFSNDENQNADFSPVQTSNKTLVRHLNKNPTLSDGKIRMNCSSSPIKSPNKMVHTRTMLRTYKVIPLQANAGVIEWVSDAQTLGNFLTTTHDEINKKTLTCREARAIMKAEFDRPVSNPISKYSVYANKIVPYFPPVLSKFFSQSPMNRSCADWLEMRQNYTQSVAISSVVGHVVGLGDRHCQNIMIDRKSGQILHIDLSMIFEAGTLLKIPELVPFRLTRDMVDGMGFLGLESSFKPIAEWTISLLRQKQNLLLTVLEAFEEDPLYKWPSFSSSRLKNSAIKVKSSAKYCLARVAQKLRGIEMSSQGSQFAPHGSSCILSPAGQIAHLVQIATDPERLAQMYPGWQSWM